MSNRYCAVWSFSWLPWLLCLLPNRDWLTNTQCINLCVKTLPPSPSSQTPLQSPSSNASVGDLLGDFAAPAPAAAAAAAGNSDADLWSDFASAAPVKSSGNWEQF